MRSGNEKALGRWLRTVEKHPAISALAVVSILVFSIFIFFTPLLNSGDDAHIMYLLSGGYGESPTHLLHYNHIWHPVLGWIVKSLFTAVPSVNWYTFALFLFHFTSCVYILRLFLAKAGAETGLLLFLIFFFLFEIRFLLSLSFTSTSIITAMAGFLYLHSHFNRSRAKWTHLLPGLMLVFLSGLLRMHTTWLVLLLFIPFAMVGLERKAFFKWIAACAGLIAVLFLLNLQHRAFYQKNIPGWEKQESRRQALFYAYNRPVKEHSMDAFRDSAEMQLYFSGFHYDTSQFSTERLSTIGRQITRQRWLNAKEDRQGLYWFLVEMRVYFLLFAVVIGFLLFTGAYHILKKWAWSLAAVVLVYGGLFVFLKLTPALHVGFLTVLWLHLAVLVAGSDHGKRINSWVKASLGIILLFAFFWMGIRMVKENELNVSRKKMFNCALEELNRHSDRLFVATDDSFPLSYFYCWYRPSNYAVRNLLYKDRLLTNTYTYTLGRFNIADLDNAIVNDERVYLLGTPVPALEKKYGAKYSGKFPGFRCLEIRKLLAPW